MPESQIGSDTMLGAVAQLERSLIKERQREGINLA